MVEKVDGIVEDAPARAGAAPFTAEKVRVCWSCETVNRGDAAKCSTCGESLGPKSATETVPATCPHCAGDRPMVPEHTEVDADGHPYTTKEKYFGNCPHCAQTAGSANDAKAALEKGQFPEWGQKSSKFYP